MTSFKRNYWFDVNKQKRQSKHNEEANNIIFVK